MAAAAGVMVIRAMARHDRRLIAPNDVSFLV
jgi:hypothetical protein